MRLIACVNQFEDASFLEQSLPAIRSTVDLLVVVDGRYADYPGDHPGSRDGSLDIARHYGAHVIEPVNGLPWASEIEKRNAYLSVGDPGDYYFVVDADEIVVGHIDRDIMTTHDDWLVDLIRIRKEQPLRQDLRQPIHRLFKHRAGIRYHGTHHAVHIADRLIHPDRLPLFPGAHFVHRTEYRDDKRNEAKGVYYRTLVKQEITFRERYGL